MAAIAIAYALLAVLELGRGKRRRLMALADHVAAPRARSRRSDPYSACRLAVAHYPFHPIADLCSLRGIVPLHLRGIFICKSREGSNCSPHQNVSLDRPTDRRGEPSWLFPGGRAADDRTRFTNRPAALLTFDLDRFKSINDKFGHLAGDTVLVRFCRLATSQVRPTDLFGRIGGEEFASLLPDTTRQDAILLAERLRAAFEATCHTVAERRFTATVSVGVAISDDASSDLSALLDRGRSGPLSRQGIGPQSCRALDAFPAAAFCSASVWASRCVGSDTSKPQ